MLSTAAILFEPDAYVLDGPKLMGRQSAGNAFLRAAVAGRGRDPMICYTPNRASADVFTKLVKGLDPAAEGKWIPSGQGPLLQEAGTLYLPGPNLDGEANLRLRTGAGAYSLVGVTHTTASKLAMDSIACLVSAPVMPWDALICTSGAVLQTVETVLDANRAYFDWRFGTKSSPQLPQLPVIPLGVHAADFSFSDKDRAQARRALGIGADAICVLFVGRLSFHAKAHPFQMYRALDAVTRRTGKKIVLIQCGWFANGAIESAFKDGARQFAPSVTSLFTDGKLAGPRNQSWAAADIFISLSDNIQETFGLSPLEAMAAGLPVVVSDWDGYKESVRDGVDGFRIATYAPPPGSGETVAAAFDSNDLNYDQYCAATCRTISVDQGMLEDRLEKLAGDKELRHALGAAGRRRIREIYDWAHVYARYKDLYADLAARRRAAVTGGAPRAAPGRLDPTLTFGHYSTANLLPATVIAKSDDAQSFKTLSQHPLFGYLPALLPSAEHVEAVMAALAAGPRSIESLSAAAAMAPVETAYLVAILLKMGLVRASV